MKTYSVASRAMLGFLVVFMARATDGQGSTSISGGALNEVGVLDLNLQAETLVADLMENTDSSVRGLNQMPILIEESEKRPTETNKGPKHKDAMLTMFGDMVPQNFTIEQQSRPPMALGENQKAASLIQANKVKLHAHAHAKSLKNKPKNTFDADAPSIPIGQDGKELPPLTHKTLVYRPMIEGGHANDPNPETDFGHKKVPHWSKAKHHGSMPGQMKTKKQKAKSKSKASFGKGKFKKSPKKSHKRH